VSTIFTFDEIMAAKDMEPMEVPVPEWGNSVLLVRPLAPGENVRAYEAAKRGDTVDQAAYAKALFAASVVGPALTDAQVDAIWANRSDKAVQRVSKAINDLNAFSPAVQEAMKADFRAESGQTVEIPADGALPNPDGTRVG